MEDVLLNRPMPTDKLRKSILFLIQLLLLSVVLGLLAYQLHSYGPTIGDLDPDGYVSYAYGLTETKTIQPHRRLPGYPLIMAIVAHAEITQLTPIMSDGFLRIDSDSISSVDVAVKMFWFHLILAVAFVAGTVGLAWRFFGYPVAVVYSTLMAYNSYFARDAIVMLADLPLVVMFYATCLIGLLFLTQDNRLKLLYAVLFSLGCVFSIAIHPSAHMLFQILIVSACVVFGLRKARAAPKAKRLELVKRVVTPLLILSVLAFASNALVSNTLQLSDRQDYLGGKEVSSRNFLKSWIGFRMLLCLPPGSQSDALDTEIEILKSKVSLRTGYPIDAVVPPGYYAEFMPLVDGKTIESDRWKNRISQHPFAILGCAASEFRAKYNVLIRNLTPFTDFEHDKTWITPDYPVNTGSPRDELFWSTGVNLFRVLQADAPSSSVTSAAKIEVARIILVIALTVGGLIMIGRRFPGVGLVITGSLFVWVCVLPTALPLETRYLMTFFPIIYTGQAILIVWMFGSALNFAAKGLNKTLSLFKRTKP